MKERVTGVEWCIHYSKDTDIKSTLPILVAAVAVAAKNFRSKERYELYVEPSDFPENIEFGVPKMYVVLKNRQG